MSIKLKLPDQMGGFSADGQEFKVQKAKGVRFVEVEIEHVGTALSHGLDYLDPQPEADAQTDGGAA